jgi:SPP1 family predicted phage head-tail adaptor
MKKDITSMLNKRIILQYAVEIIDEQASVITEWYDHLSVFSHVSAFNDYRLATSEVYQFMQLTSVNPFVFIIRFIEDINPKMRIKYNNRIFNILRVVNPDEGNVILKIITKEEVV